SSVLGLNCGDDDAPVAPTGGGSEPLSFNDFQDASVVVGQVNKTSGGQNAGGTAGPIGLNSPAGAGAGSFYIPDTFNHRILGYTEIPTADGEAADFVVGQPDFTTVVSGTTSQNFNLTSDCVASGGKLFLADGSNHRVLIWNTLPTANTPASVVVGQADFTSSGSALTQAGFSLPFRVFVAGGKLFVGDLNNRRVLVWNSIPTTNGEAADVVVGQADFTSNVNALTAAGMNGPRAIWSDGTRLVVSDAGNRRVLIWNSIPTTNGQAADVVVGAPDFTTAGSATASATTIDGAWGVASDGTSLFVADTFNNRITVFTPFPTTNGAAAVGVLGQSNFTNETRNDANQDGVADANPTARTLWGPTGLKVIGDRLVVADQSNHRMLIFESN
ncbi:MAG: hypothetical protein L0Z51_10315, partial [Candidatus Latescibacteria bacterium]|nr:hypothetical protein [Candidatus Latescibacterota bacterium]